MIMRRMFYLPGKEVLLNSLMRLIPGEIFQMIKLPMLKDYIQQTADSVEKEWLNNFRIFCEPKSPLKGPYRIDWSTIVLITRVVIFLSICPLFLIIAIFIRLDSSGPGFYVGVRLKKPEIESKDYDHYLFPEEEIIKYFEFRTI